MDYRNILTFLALVLSFVVFRSANASQGPNVGLGSNPIDSFYQNSCNNTTVFTNNTQQDFIITDVVNSWSGWVRIRKNDGGVYSNLFMLNGNGSVSLTSGIKIEPGVIVDCTHYSGSGVFISGFYAHR